MSETPEALELGFGKYLTPSSASLVLSKRTLRWSRPALFNDPFDSAMKFRFGPDFDDIRANLVSEFNRALDNEISSYSIVNTSARLVNAMSRGLQAGLADRGTYEKHFLDYVLDIYSDPGVTARFFDEVVSSFSKSKILCLTRSLNNILMWSHYAQNHEGALLVFSPRSQDSMFDRAIQIFYTDELPYIFDSEEVPLFFTGQTSFTDRAFLVNIANKVIFRKTKDWEYEREWRIMAGDGRSPDEEIEYVPFDEADLIGVIFGCRANNSNIQEIQDIVRTHYSSAKIFKARRSGHSSTLEYVAASKP